MQAIFWYLIKVIICSSILYAYYWFALRNKIYHSYNRFYLLAIVVLSILLPITRVAFFSHGAEDNQLIKILGTVQANDEFMETIFISNTVSNFSWQQLLWPVYTAVSVVMSFFFVRAISKIFILKKRSPLQKYEGVNLVHTNHRNAPFSFFKNIFWNDEIALTSENGERILKHELAHVTEQHSVDKVLINIILLFFWFNPIFWLLRKELFLIHEFIADKKAVEAGDTAAFAEMILAATYPRHQFKIANNFFYSPIKRRLAMLTKQNKQKIGYLARLLVLPLAAIVFVAFTLKASQDQPPARLSEKIVVVLDAGHGGDDDGGVAPDGTKEKNLALQLVQKIKTLNKNSNIEIILTRSGDETVTVKNRPMIAEKYNADLLISIHLDNGPKGTENTKTGTFLYVSKEGSNNNTASKLMASSFISDFQKGYGLQVEQSVQQRKTGIWILQESKCPAIIIEAGFINNAKDLGYLKSEAGQTAFANNVLKAIEKFSRTDSFSALRAAKYTKDANETTIITVSEKAVPVTEQTGTETVRLGGPISMSIKSNENNELLGKALIIVDGKEMAYEELKSKTITAKSGSMYHRDNKEMLTKYGEKAKNGVWVFTGATVSDGDATSAKNDLNIVAEDMTMVGGESRSTKPKETSIYVVDGQVSTKSEVDNLNPSNINSIHVLKGDAAQTKYGIKEGGAIEVSTKKADENEGIETPAQQDPLENRIYIKTEVPASFPGGPEAWRQYLIKNLDANIAVKEDAKPGSYTVQLKFIVAANGTISNVTVEKGMGPLVNKHCIDLIKNGPKWIPAVQNGRKVTSYQRQPIVFQINS